MLEKGVSIGQVGAHLDAKKGAGKKLTRNAADYWRDSQERMINALSRFDQGALDALYNDALALYPVDVVTRKLIIPLLKLLGRRWASSEGSVAEEHFFGVYLRNKLGARLHHQRIARHSEKLVAACLPGEHHEVGLLLFCLAAAEKDYALIILGADMPCDELAIVAERAAASAIVLSGRVIADDDIDALEQQLSELVDTVNVPVYVGGEVSVNYYDVIKRTGALPVGDNITKALQIVEETIAIE